MRNGEPDTPNFPDHCLLIFWRTFTSKRCVVLCAGSADAQRILRPGDEIVQANEKVFTGLTHYTAWNYLKSLPEGTIKLVIQRKAWKIGWSDIEFDQLNRPNRSSRNFAKRNVSAARTKSLPDGNWIRKIAGVSADETLRAIWQLKMFCRMFLWRSAVNRNCDIKHKANVKIVLEINYFIDDIPTSANEVPENVCRTCTSRLWTTHLRGATLLQIARGWICIQLTCMLVWLPVKLGWKFSRSWMVWKP